MLQKLCLISLIVFSACNGGPKVTVCIVDFKNNGLQCVDHNKKESFLTYEQADNYVALSPDDSETLLNYCKLNKKDE